jgi:hypothetical protein
MARSCIEKLTLSLFWSAVSVCGIQWRWNFINPKSLWRIRKQLAFPMQMGRQRSLHDINGRSASINWIPSARSCVRGVPDLGSSMRSVLPSWKSLRHFFTVDQESASGPYIDSSSAWVSLALSLLRVTDRVTARHSMILITPEHRFQILILNLLHQKWSKTEKFNMTQRIDKNMHKFVLNFFKTQ